MKSKRAVKVILGLFIIIVIIFLIQYWIPVKYSIREENFKEYKNYILVKEFHSTGTCWVVIGDEKNGYYEEEIDVVLYGEKLPEFHVGYGGDINTFLCIAKYEGEVKHDLYQEKIPSYTIKEWYPVYPVVRNPELLPKWLFPKEFMNKHDVKSY